MKTAKVVLLSTAITLAACNQSGNDIARPSAQPSTPTQAAANAEQRNPSAELEALTDELMVRILEANPYLQMMAGKKITAMPDNSFAGAHQQAENAKVLLQRLAAIKPERLSHDDQLTYSMFKGQLEQTIEGERFFWHKFNITPYAVGNGVSLVLAPALSSATFASETDIEDYLALLKDVARYVSDDLKRLKGQEQRGILLPKGAVPGARVAIEGVAQTIRELTQLSDKRLSGLDDAQKIRLTRGVSNAVEDLINPAIESLLTYIGDDYVARAPETVGLGQYPGGEDAYRFAIRQQTTMDLHPAEIHKRGLQYMAEIQQEMATIRKELGFEGSREEFHRQMRNNPRFYAKTPQEVEERYMAYVRRIEPHIDDYFSVLPKAPYGVKRLDLAAEPGMTFGYYQAPSPLEPTGNYRFNGSKLESRPMVWTGALVYHELVPGHHFHIALAKENEQASEFRKATPMMYAAFTEGWANYGASLSYEMGIMDDPWDRYGWLLFNAFITNRLVVDTGMNYHGWSLEKARQYMMANTFSSIEEVATETLRYSTDMPAQSLAYKLGYEKIREIRRAQEQKLGDKFDIKKFHAATVGTGGMPLPMLEKHVDWYLSNNS